MGERMGDLMAGDLALNWVAMMADYSGEIMVVHLDGSMAGSKVRWKVDYWAVRLVVTMAESLVCMWAGLRAE